MRHDDPIIAALACMIIAIVILWFEIRSTPYREGCHECNVHLARILEEKQKSAGQNKSDQRKPPGAGGGGGWAV